MEEEVNVHVEVDVAVAVALCVPEYTRDGILVL
jgi:hypothetical protein